MSPKSNSLPSSSTSTPATPMTGSFAGSRGPEPCGRAVGAAEGSKLLPVSAWASAAGSAGSAGSPTSAASSVVGASSAGAPALPLRPPRHRPGARWPRRRSSAACRRWWTRRRSGPCARSAETRTRCRISRPLLFSDRQFGQIMLMRLPREVNSAAYCNGKSAGAAGYPGDSRFRDNTCKRTPRRAAMPGARRSRRRLPAGAAAPTRPRRSRIVGSGWRRGASSCVPSPTDPKTPSPPAAAPSPCGPRCRCA